MPYLQEYIVSKGITLKNAFTTTPVDCPMRTSYVVCSYFHNVSAPGGESMNVDPINNIFSIDSKILFPNSKLSWLRYMSASYDSAHNYCPKDYLKLL